jgi:hypothetical protein
MVRVVPDTNFTVRVRVRVCVCVVCVCGVWCVCGVCVCLWCVRGEVVFLYL